MGGVTGPSNPIRGSDERHVGLSKIEKARESSTNSKTIKKTESIFARFVDWLFEEKCIEYPGLKSGDVYKNSKITIPKINTTQNKTKSVFDRVIDWFFKKTSINPNNGKLKNSQDCINNGKLKNSQDYIKTVDSGYEADTEQEKHRNSNPR